MMQRAIVSFAVRRAVASRMALRPAVAAAAAMTTGVRFQSQVPPGVPPEMRAPGGRGGAPPQGHDHQHDHNHDHGGAQEDFQPPQKPAEDPKFLKISTNDKAITHIQLNNGPVNSMSLEFFQEFNQWMLWLGSNEETKAVVISSAIATVFSAGLELSELHNPKPERLTAFWNAFQEMWLILNTFPKPVVAAITGNSPAGGCILAMGADYRIMVKGPSANNADSRRDYRIGLNEAKLGIVAPAWTMPAYSYLLGSRTAERMLQLGETPTAVEAQKVGLVDAVVDDDAAAVLAAHQWAERFLAVPQQSRWMARDMMRREYLQMLSSEEDRSFDTEFTTQLIANPDVQKSLTAYLQRLKGRK